MSWIGRNSLNAEHICVTLTVFWFIWASVWPHHLSLTAVRRSRHQNLRADWTWHCKSVGKDGSDGRAAMATDVPVRPECLAAWLKERSPNPVDCSPGPVWFGSVRPSCTCTGPWKPTAPPSAVWHLNVKSAERVNWVFVTMQEETRKWKFISEKNILWYELQTKTNWSLLRSLLDSQTCIWAAWVWLPACVKRVKEINSVSVYIKHNVRSREWRSVTLTWTGVGRSPDPAWVMAVIGRGGRGHRLSVWCSVSANDAAWAVPPRPGRLPMLVPVYTSGFLEIGSTWWRTLEISAPPVLFKEKHWSHLRPLQLLRHCKLNFVHKLKRPLHL